MYALQIYLNHELQVKCPDAWVYTCIQQESVWQSVWWFCEAASFAVNLFWSCLPVYHSVWFVGSHRLSPHSLLVFHLICLKTLSVQLSSKSNLGAWYKIFQRTKTETDSLCKIRFFFFSPQCWKILESCLEISENFTRNGLKPNDQIK